MGVSDLLETSKKAISKLDRAKFSTGDINIAKAGWNLGMYSDHEDLSKIQDSINQYVQHPYSKISKNNLHRTLKEFEVDWDFVVDEKEKTVFQYLLSEDGHKDLRNAIKETSPKYDDWIVNKDGSWGPKEVSHVENPGQFSRIATNTTRDRVFNTMLEGNEKPKGYK